MIHARLNPGADNSGKLVAEVKKKARTVASESGKELVLIDGSPGIGCPVVSSLTGADYVILVTEPTLSGFHDIKRVYELVKKFGIKSSLIINKYDLNRNITNELESFAEAEGIKITARLPYDEAFTEAQVKGLTVAETGGTELRSLMTKAWEEVLTDLGELNEDCIYSKR